MATGERLQIAIEQIKFARGYTNQLLADVNDGEWFTIPDGCVSHLAWQMGHLAMAEYGLDDVAFARQGTIGRGIHNE